MSGRGGRGTSPDEGADGLAIAGLERMSTVDWPGRLVATVFLQGCPWRCTYCHNSAILDPRTPGVVAWQEVRDLLGRRVGLLDGVVLSGGEPTRQPAIVAAAREVRAAGFGVGLHTAGAYPRALAQVLPYVDWVGLDVKAPAARYRDVVRVGGPTTAAAAVEASLDLVLAAGVDLQVRTTVDPTVLTEEDVAGLVERLRARGVREHVLQTVRPDGTSPAYRSALAAAGGPRPGWDVGARRG
ncbi:anaerobic ribonucleoside-triphosphate reductase activating protein [Cellulomonas marina]|uniref:Pyruvate formate lyase activating enzyme n=1 Tax=Cellulomonas marina TaxID=988821 RepID=A0A1I0XGZ1_9CELL|nr:anaerobic ribonucleoside-triphosphate reductase activating protein [Cellulomonas marina]GIG29828.1 anaerobic ribonucleoside-triphosphate reductase activating protein [Cellulomonas marina]SFB00295.1 pyruvate formate lyase activating enzyme [Cellulomonas marina]